MSPVEQREEHRDPHADRGDEFPSRAVFGELSWRMPRMSSSGGHEVGEVDDALLTASTHALRRPPFALLEHLEHAVGDDEAADDVDRREDDGDEPERLLQVGLGRARDQSIAADEDDAVDGVRARHQRRVQHGRHLRDHLEPEEHREHEDRDRDR